MARTTHALAISGALALLLTACGGDTPAAMQESLSTATPTLAYIDDEHASCAAEAILSAVGFEQLAIEGHTSQTITADPSAIEAIVETHDSDQLRSGLTDCLDVNDMFRAQLASQSNELSCDTLFEPGEELVDEFLNNRFEGTDVSVSIDDTTENRDLLRSCFSEAHFADTFGLDLASDLAPALTGSLPKDVAATPCAGERIVEHFGTEQLNDLGVSVEDPKLDLGSLDLEDADTDAIVASVAECSELAADKRNDLRSDQPVHGECGLDAVEEAWTDVSIRAALGDGRSNAATWLLDDAVEDCAVDKAEKVAGRSLDAQELQTAKRLANLIEQWNADDDYAATGAMLDCAFMVAVSSAGGEELDRAIDDLFSEDEAEAWRAAGEFLRLLYPARLACEGDSIFVSLDLYRGGFSAETIECTEREFGGADEIAQLSMQVHTQLEPSATDFSAMIAIWDGWVEAVEDCSTSDEASQVASLRTYYATMEELEDPGLI